MQFDSVNNFLCRNFYTIKEAGNCLSDTLTSFFCPVLQQYFELSII